MFPGIVRLKMALTQLHDVTCPSQNTGDVLNREKSKFGSEK
jgi:hypothetical protein